MLRERIFLKSLALVYFFAFLSLTQQVKVLFYADGIIPIQDYLNYVASHLLNPLERFARLPSLFWFNQSDSFIYLLSLVATVIAIIYCLQIKLQSRFVDIVVFLFLYLSYLSFVNATQVFLSFQWDILLLEIGLLTVLYLLFNNQAASVFVWIFRILVFKLMFMSGLVKLASHDQTWANLTALQYHYQTQPLPNPLSYFFHQLPLGCHQVSCLLMFVVELILPWFIFINSKLRRFAAWAFIALQVLIIVSGNYCFFNILTIVLCLWLFDELTLQRLLPANWAVLPEIKVITYDNLFARQITQGLSFVPSVINWQRWWRVFVILASLLILIFYSVISFSFIATKSSRILSRSSIWQPMQDYYFKNYYSWYFSNPYGLFAVMTTTRNEIIIQGSYDGENWKDYEFKYKPGELKKYPSQIAPMQPRLDWQMWFAALSDIKHNQWLLKVVLKLLEGDKDLLKLFALNPFPELPPKYIRLKLYEYQFNDWKDFVSTDNIWKREECGIYLPPLELRNFAA